MRFAWLAVLAFVAVAGPLLAGPGLAGAQGQDKVRVEMGPDKKTVRSMTADDAEVRELLRELFRAVDVSYSIAPEIHGTITIDIRNATFDAALATALKQVDATYLVEGGVYEIISRNRPQGESSGRNTEIHIAQKPIRIEVGPDSQKLRVVTINQADVREAIQRLFEVTGATGYSIAPDVQGTVALEMKDVRFQTVLENLCSQVDATYRMDSGIYRVVRRDSGHRDRRLLRVALEPSGEPWETALRRLVASGLNYRVEAGVYYLLNPSGEPVAQLVPPSTGGSAGSATITQDSLYLYILRGDSLVKVSKKDLKVVARGSIALRSR